MGWGTATLQNQVNVSKRMLRQLLTKEFVKTLSDTDKKWLRSLFSEDYVFQKEIGLR
ncbi:MAG: hypothetical protein ABIF92_02250 [archaeon]